ncbi:unnamed protein product [Urochloa decumbens]|uniref:DUF1618 domain-containing protein n=1 Tax=Urochloa decumbens TaxID=240449 RepID=A0ABC8VZ26_9POAL
MAAYPAASTSGRSGLSPDCVLLETVTHMGRSRDTATAATTNTSSGCPIEVSFVLADPPSLTRCAIACRHLPCGQFLEDAPHITGADGAFLLITAVFPNHPARSERADLFVYNSGGPGNHPSLQLLPHPYPVGYMSNHIGVLSCGDHCLVIIPRREFEAGGQTMHYLLHIFSSKTGLWSTKVAKLAPGMKMYCGRFEPAKAFSVGEGSIAWVDTRYGILLFDSVAGDEPAVWRLIELPPLMPINVENQGERVSMGCCLVSIRSGMSSTAMAGSAAPKFYWQGAMFKRRVRTDDQGWYHGTVIDSAGLLPANSCVPYLFPEIYYKDNKELALGNVMSLFPTLVPNYEGVVYMMATMGEAATDPNGWVLAVNTNFKKLAMLAPFSRERFRLDRTFMPCAAFTKHLSRASGACNTNGWKLNSFKEQLMPLVVYVVSILLAQQKFRQFGKYFTKGRPSTDEVWTVRHLGVAATSTMNVHIHQVTQYATSIGVGKAASDAAKSFQRASEDIEKILERYCWAEPTARGKDVGDKINVAVGALDELLHTLPSVVLDIGRSMIPVYEPVNEVTPVFD